MTELVLTRVSNDQPHSKGIANHFRGELVYTPPGERLPICVLISWLVAENMRFDDAPNITNGIAMFVFCTNYEHMRDLEANSSQEIYFRAHEAPTLVQIGERGESLSWAFPSKANKKVMVDGVLSIDEAFAEHEVDGCKLVLAPKKEEASWRLYVVAVVALVVIAGLGLLLYRAVASQDQSGYHLDR